MRHQINTAGHIRLGEIHERVFQYLLEHPCVDCGLVEPCVTEFDHRDPKEKSRNVSSLLRDGYAWKVVLAEIKKCDVRCANCHRRKTAQDQGWFSWRLAQQQGLVAQLAERWTLNP